MKFVPLFLSFLAIIVWRLAYLCIINYSCVARSLVSNFDIVIKSIGIFGLAFFLPAFISIFVGKTSFKNWIKFVCWWLPLSAIMIFITEDSHNIVDPFSKDFVAFGMAVLFTIISLIIIAVSAWKARKKTT